MTRLFYSVPPGSRVREVYDLLVADRRDAMASLVRFRDKVGAHDMITRGDHIVGAFFEGDAPKPWRKRGSGTMWVPDNTKAGKALKAEAQTMPSLRHSAYSESSWLSSHLGDQYSQYDEGCLHFSFFMNFPNQLVLTVPWGLTHPPPGCDELYPSVVMTWIDAAKSAERKRKDAAKS